MEADPPSVTPAALDAAPRLRAPRSCGELFRVFTRLAMMGFGGVLPVAQRELVERERWLDREQFLQMFSIGQVLPGPNIINFALMFGDRHFGWRGALAAMAGLMCAPTALVLALAIIAVQIRDVPGVAGALRGMGIASSGLILGLAIKLGAGLRRNPLGPALTALFGLATFAAVGLMRWPLAACVFAVGGLSIAATWWRLKPAAA